MGFKITKNTFDNKAVEATVRAAIGGYFNDGKYIMHYISTLHCRLSTTM